MRHRHLFHLEESSHSAEDVRRCCGTKRDVDTKSFALKNLVQCCIYVGDGFVLRICRGANNCAWFCGWDGDDELKHKVKEERCISVYNHEKVCVYFF